MYIWGIGIVTINNLLSSHGDYRDIRDPKFIGFVGFRPLSIPILGSGDAHKTS